MQSMMQAKDAQGLLEAKIAQLQDIISQLAGHDESQIDTSKVQILNKVTIKNIKTKATDDLYFGVRKRG